MVLNAVEAFHFIVNVSDVFSSTSITIPNHAVITPGGASSSCLLSPVDPIPLIFGFFFFN